MSDESEMTKEQEVFYREKAKVLWADPSSDDIEVDDDAKLSETDNGVWVQAWVWVEKPLCEECSEPYDESLGEGPWALCNACMAKIKPEKEVPEPCKSDCARGGPENCNGCMD